MTSTVRRPDLKIDLCNDSDWTRQGETTTMEEDVPPSRRSTYELLLFVAAAAAVGQDDGIDDRERKFPRRISPMVVGSMIEMR